MSEAPPTARPANARRDGALLGIAVAAVFAALAVVIMAVLSRGSLASSGDERPSDLEPPPGRSAGDIGKAPSRAIADRAPDEIERMPTSSWTPVPLSKEGAAVAVDDLAALKKCCESLRAAPRRAFGRASDACERVLATVSSRAGAAADTLAAAALGAIRDAAGRQPKPAGAPAPCR